MNHDFHMKRLEESLSYIQRAHKQTARGMEEARIEPTMAMKRLETILCCLEEASEILEEQLDQLGD